MKFTLGKKMVAGLAGTLAMLGLSGYQIYSKTAQIRDLEEHSLGVAAPSLQLSTALQRDLNQTQSKGRETALAGSNAARSKVAWQRFGEAWNAVDADIAGMTEYSKTWVIKVNLERLAAIKNELPALRKNQETFMKLAATPKPGAVTQAGNLFADVCTKNTAEIKKSLDAMAAAQSQLISSSNTKLEVMQASLLKTEIATAIVALVATCIVVLWVSRIIASVATRVLARAQAISQGDLSGTPLAVSSTDELGDLSRAVNDMQSSLREMIAAVSAAAMRIATASEELSATAIHQSQGAETQKDQTHQVATAMHEMSATVQQVSLNSNKAAEVSRNAAEIARHGGNIVEGTLVKMQAISDSVGQTAAMVKELGDSSSHIGEIIGAIETIANQTNLLAFNAAIEAARAGEQGRGFAVVADEVRKLAVSTTKATQEITQTIRKIQAGTLRAVKAMELGTEHVALGVQSTTQAGSSLKEIIESSGQVGDMVLLIATAATQQAAATEQVNSNIAQIAKITSETAVGATESAKAIQELAALSFGLQNLVSKFKFDGVADAHLNAPPPAPAAAQRNARNSESTRELIEVG